MDVQAWLEAALADARRRGLPELEPLLKALAQSAETLRRADLSDSADDDLTTRVERARRGDPR